MSGDVDGRGGISAHATGPVFAALVKALAWETNAHYDEHAAQVRAWRKDRRLVHFEERP